MGDVLIFDYDGVLIDSFEIFMDHFLSSCKKYGYKQIKDKKDFLDLFNQNMYESMFKKGLSKGDILKIVLNVKKGLIKDQNKMELFPGIKKILHTISKNNVLIVVTSNDSEVVEKYLKSKRIDVFDEIIGSDIEPNKIKKLEYIKSNYNGNDYYYIGDTKGDIIEGKKANIKTIGVTWGWHNKKQIEEEKPYFLIDSPEEIIKIIDGREEI